MGNRPGKSSSKKSKQGSETSPQAGSSQSAAEARALSFRVAAQRETVEAFVVAFILALLFRAFLAEAFVIPTGSMAPTLMGAHKDLLCDQCGTSFQVGASRERSGGQASLVVVAGVCPNCRYVNSMDLKNEKNDATFNGDRILVSKFTYTLNEPERWDVIVFKYPGNPKQNYIKRLVGLPEETLTIRHGDVFMRPTGSDEQNNEILRKPPSTLLAMSHLVYDTDHQAPVLIEANYPSRWQPWIEKAVSPPEDSWKIERTADGLTARLSDPGGEQFKWMRYYHRWPTDEQWLQAQAGDSLADVDPYSSRAITDFYAYDSYVQVSAWDVYDSPPSVREGGRLERLLNGGYSRGKFKPQYQSGGDTRQFDDARWGGQDARGWQIGREGLHWVGDLIFETDLETSEDSAEAILELVRAGLKFRCRFDLQTGDAKLEIDDIEPRFFDSVDGNNNQQPTAKTSVRAGTRHTIRFSDCDDQLLLWVDGDLVSFDSPTTFNSLSMRSDEENSPKYLKTHPLDAAPVGIAVRGGQATIHNLRIDRDKYYIATEDSNAEMTDYDMNELWKLAGNRSVTLRDIQMILETPELWSDFVGWSTRRRVTFVLEEDQFFPMGDNSPESLDARCWAGWKRQIPMRGFNEDAWMWSDKSYVPRDLLVGKALVVFWPHSWNSPVPFLPNLKRMKLIR